MAYALLTAQQDDIICPLSHYTLIEMAGVDAEKYLQGQLTCDVTKLAAGESTLTAHCDPKGKMSALFRLIRQDEQTFYMLLKSELLPSALDQLKKYAVFSKVTFTRLDWQIIGAAGAKGIEKCGQISAQIRVAVHDRQPRVILLNPTRLSIEPTAEANVWDLLDIQDGVPGLAAATQLQFIPQALNLQSIEQAISFHKGCYIGQETVARAKYRGANKRALFIFAAQTESLPDIGSPLEMALGDNWRSTGTIISAVNFHDVLWLQAVLNTPLEDGQAFRLPDSQTALTLQPLPYELS
ncbi:CAF17-like 4Fe-4S cluster assembly/insertion protein YgfZ [Aggregatibacter actinomycetemcomitans]|uniref:CAF17-like 4Fe-4S cluster assembly/insertion protein YgfZ n=1 Tax=Aggregatibacter actinomycetemcomitans TaxID=714 RepID=UPI002151D755|nr:folate-binding protein YgfZ [Aggregatibacter actinomycetemcomitans]